jgi:hypothetical protein
LGQAYEAAITFDGQFAEENSSKQFKAPLSNNVIGHIGFFSALGLLNRHTIFVHIFYLETTTLSYTERQ